LNFDLTRFYCIHIWYTYFYAVELKWERAVKKSDESNEMREIDEEIKCNG
jgi:hypothetical protein